MHRFGGEGKYGTKRLRRKLGIALEYLLRCPARGKKSEQEVGREPSAAHDRLAAEHGGISVDVLAPVHNLLSGQLVTHATSVQERDIPNLESSIVRFTLYPEP